jgi:hypothetical protein
MALSIPTRAINDPNPAADVNLIVTEVNRVGGIVDGAVSTFLNAVDVTTDARTMGIKNVVSAPATNPVSAVKLYAELGTLKVRNPSGDVLALDGPPTSWRPDDHNLVSWSCDPTLAAASVQLTSGTIYLVKLPIRRSTTVGTIWFGVGTAAAGVTGAQTLAGLVGPTGTTLASATIATQVAATGAQSVAITPQPVAQGFCWVALLIVATTMPFLAHTTPVTNATTLMNVGLAASAYRFAVNGTAQTALPGSFTLASNTQTNAKGIWVGVS